MELKDRINAFSLLGNHLTKWLEEITANKVNTLTPVLQQAFNRNGWFTESQVVLALNAINAWLHMDSLTGWTSKYSFPTNGNVKLVGIIMAGNIPLVGFHDYLSVLISGHKLLAKLSTKDEVLIRFLHNELVKIEPRFDTLVDFSTERFNGVDAVIATGSDNSSKYFEYYFSKKPHIIRRNRTSVAVLKGNESKEEMHALGNDIFRYFGLGCRSVTKLFLPKGFDKDWFYSGIMGHAEVIHNHKYQNNYDYHKSLFLLNGLEIWDNNFLLLKEDTAMSSPVGTLFYEEYGHLDEMEEKMLAYQDQVQCRVGVGGLPLGGAQTPELTDYSDNIDVVKFLLTL